MDGEEWQWRLDPVMLNLPVAVPLLSESFNTGLVIPKPQPGAELPAGGHGKPRKPQAQPCKDSGSNWRTYSPVRTDMPLVISSAVTRLFRFQLPSVKWCISDTRESAGGKTIWSLLSWTLGVAHQLARSMPPTQLPVGE